MDPSSLAEELFLHFSTEYIDINDSSLDGKETFYATQVAASQRGPPPCDPLAEITFSKRETLHVPDAMNTIIPAHRVGEAKPVFDHSIQEKWFDCDIDSCPAALKARATDIALMVQRKTQCPKETWTAFNAAKLILNICGLSPHNPNHST